MNNITIAAKVVGKYAQNIFLPKISCDFAIKNCNPIVLSNVSCQTTKVQSNYLYLVSTLPEVRKIPRHKLCNFFCQNKKLTE